MNQTSALGSPFEFEAVVQDHPNGLFRLLRSNSLIASNILKLLFQWHSSASAFAGTCQEALRMVHLVAVSPGLLPRCVGTLLTSDPRTFGTLNLDGTTSARDLDSSDTVMAFVEKLAR